MGVNISVKDSITGEDVPEWDWMRYAGDRDVFAVMYAAPYSTILEDGEWSIYRPDNVEHFRAALHNTIAYNPNRWDQMCDLLVEDPNRGLYFSW